MIVILIIFAIIVALGIIALNAAILHTAVPALLADATNWWAWVGVLIVLGLVFGSSRVGKGK